MVPTQGKKDRKGWLLLVNRKAHSFHRDEATAQQWHKCKEHDGEDAAIVAVGEDVIETIVDLFAEGV